MDWRSPFISIVFSKKIVLFFVLLGFGECSTSTKLTLQKCNKKVTSKKIMLRERSQIEKGM